MTSTRDWDSHFMEEAVLWSKRSTCLRRHVGAVAVIDRRVLGAGFNGNLPGAKHCDEGGCERCNSTSWISGAELERCVCVHAEQNLIAWCSRRGTALEGSTLYTTTFPCSDCMKLVVSAGIAAVAYNEEYGEKLKIDTTQRLKTWRVHDGNG